ncbi:MAG TPA: tRNA (adenosine(37)-N6)-dimethylallyltransferase MiaA [Patescibacteria group bacterium]|nr:tRNA (adenosine(37)-N6)-dimethylallyltransferase MiaA [Patescibacteria group bacterium]
MSIIRRSKLVVILGPTASGKTRLSLELAKKYNGEIISADSRQIYRGMDIGTAKASGIWKKIQGAEYLEVEGIPHFMIDLVDPDGEFTLLDFQRQAVSCVQKIHARGKLPLLVGGTGLYIAAVVHNYHIPQGSREKNFREFLETKTNEQLYLELLLLAPDTANKIDKNNKRRIIRALEVARQTGGEFTALTQKGEPLFDVLQLGVFVDREVLYERINERVDDMIYQGLVHEASELLTKYDASLPSMSGIGYRQMVGHIQGNISLADAIRMIKRDTRRYARRQMTWFRRETGIQWVTTYEEADACISNFLKA